MAVVAAIFLGKSSRACPELTPPSATVELSETEVKYLVPDLQQIPSNILWALKDGVDHEQILRRGFVVQEYLAVTEENLREFFAALNSARIPFGSLDIQNEFVRPGVAQEIRMMSKTIKIGGRATTISQAAVKGAGTISVSQIESPETLTQVQQADLKKIFDRFRSAVQARVRKVYFEFYLSGVSGHSVELDIFINPKGLSEPVLFMNGEVEFHGASKELATLAAQAWQRELHNIPPFFTLDITDLKGVKSRDIAFRGPPETVLAALKPFTRSNQEWVQAMAHEFSQWADPTVFAQFKSDAETD